MITTQSATEADWVALRSHQTDPWAVPRVEESAAGADWPPADEPAFLRSVYLRGRLVGVGGLWDIDLVEPGAARFGYVALPRLHSREYLAMAVNAIMRDIVAETDIVRIYGEMALDVEPAVAAWRYVIDRVVKENAAAVASGTWWNVGGKDETQPMRWQWFLRRGEDLA